MFARRYFGAHYFAPRWFGSAGGSGAGGDDLVAFMRRRRQACFGW